ncbi:hypothetical protein MMPV_008249 [Pyropia vietnamensis]
MARPPDGVLTRLAAAWRALTATAAPAAATAATAATTPSPPGAGAPSVTTGAAAGGTVGLKRLNHVAVAVPDLAAATAFYRDVLGAAVSAPAAQAAHGVTTVFVGLGNTQLELLSPLGTDSPIANFLARRPAGGIHHVCVEVGDLPAAVAVLRSRGVRLLADEIKVGAHGKGVMFLHPGDCGGVLLELEQA